MLRLRSARNSAVALTSAALVLTACGSSSNGASTSSPVSTGASPSSSGSTIKLMTLTSLTGPQPRPQIAAAAQAAAKAVNDSGALKGARIEILSCDDKFTPQAAGDCARKAVAEKVTAVVGAVSAFGDVYMPILEQAGIPSVAGLPNSPAETTSPLSYPITSSALILTAAAAVAKADGAKSVSYLGPNVPAYVGLVQLTKGLLQGAGIPLKSSTTYPPTATDYTQYVASAYGSGADAVVPVLTAAGTLPAFVNAVKGGGYSIRKPLTVLAGTTFTPSALDGQLKGKLDGAYVINTGQTPTDTSLPGIKTFHDEVQAAGEKIEFDDSALEAWVGVHVIGQLLGKSGAEAATPASLVGAMKAAGPISYPGWTPFDWSKPALPAPLSKAFPRYFNATAWASKIVDNKLVTATDAPFPFTGPVTLK